MKTHKRKELKSAEILVFVILLVCHVFPLQANLTAVRNLDNGSGLQDPKVSCIMKDSKGFVWFGTLNTIQRFDGVQFKCFYFPEQVEKVFVIKEIENSDFLIGTNKGLWKYEAKSEILLRIFPEINFPVRSLCYINGKVYVGTSNGIYIIDKEQKLEHLRITDEISAYNQIIGAYATAKDIWFLSPEGIIAYTLSTGGIRVYGKDVKFTSKLSCVVGNDKLLYIGTVTHGVVIFDMLSGEYSSFLPSVGNNHVSALSLRDGILCCGTLGSGVFFISLPEQQIIHSISAMPNDNDEYLTSDMISCLLLDNMNVLWIGSTSYMGVDYLQFRNKPFYPYRFGNQELRNKVFNSLYFVDGIKLLGTPNGFYYICASKSQIEYFPSSLEKNSFGYTSAFIKYNDDILIGTRGGGAYKLDRHTLQLSKFTETNLDVNSFAIDNQGYLWITTLNGLYCYNKNLKIEKVYTNLNSTLVDDKVNYLYIDTKERCWVATDKGLQFLNTKEGIFSDESLPAELHELPSVTYMTEDRQGNFLFCFNKNRVFICDSTFNHLRYVCTPEDAGYLGYSIREVLQDKANNYWLVGSRGVVKGDSALNHFTLFSSTEGLPEPYSNDGQLCGDTIWLATAKGIVFADIHSVPQSAPTVISDFLVNGVSVLAEYGELIEKRGVIALPEDQNTLDITFATLTYDVPDLMIYEYQLEGYDKEWKILRGINSIKFSNLSPGEYTFKVRKQMDENSMQSFQIRIRSSLSAWLWLGFALGGVLIAGVIYTIEKKRRGKKTIQVKPLHNEEEKYRFNKKISDEEAQVLISKLKNYMEKERAFLNPELKLAHVADAVGTSTQTLSQIFNVNLKTRYYDFVNEYRIDEFKRLVSSNEKDRYTLKALAGLCGFSSYTTFFRAFKETTGITPNEYMQQVEPTGR